MSISFVCACTQRAADVSAPPQVLSNLVTHDTWPLIVMAAISQIGVQPLDRSALHVLSLCSSQCRAQAQACAESLLRASVVAEDDGAMAEELDEFLLHVESEADGNAQLTASKLFSRAKWLEAMYNHLIDLAEWDVDDLAEVVERPSRRVCARRLSATEPAPVAIAGSPPFRREGPTDGPTLGSPAQLLGGSWIGVVQRRRYGFRIVKTRTGNGAVNVGIVDARTPLHADSGGTAWAVNACTGWLWRFDDPHSKRGRQLCHLAGEWGRDGVTVSFTLELARADLYIAIDVDGDTRLSATLLCPTKGQPGATPLGATPLDPTVQLRPMVEPEWPTVRPFARLFAPGDQLRLEHSHTTRRGLGN